MRGEIRKDLLKWDAAAAKFGTLICFQWGKQSLSGNHHHSWRTLTGDILLHCYSSILLAEKRLSE